MNYFSIYSKKMSTHEQHWHLQKFKTNFNDFIVFMTDVNAHLIY